MAKDNGSRIMPSSILEMGVALASPPIYVAMKAGQYAIDSYCDYRDARRQDGGSQHGAIDLEEARRSARR